MKRRNNSFPSLLVKMGNKSKSSSFKVQAEQAALEYKIEKIRDKIEKIQDKMEREGTRRQVLEPDYGKLISLQYRYQKLVKKYNIACNQ